MMGSLAGLGSVLLGLLPALVYFVLVGLAVRVLLRPTRLPDGLFVSAALGLAVSSVLVSVSFVLLRTMTPVVWVVGAAAVVIVGVGVWRGRRPVDDWRELAGWADLAALLGAVVALLPVLAQGRRYWTMGTHDFPNYMASAHVWLGQAGEAPDFGVQHPDRWGQFMEDRAEFEKPVVTGLMVVVRVVAGLPLEDQLSVLMLLALGILIASMAAVLQDQFGLGPGWAALGVLPPVLSLAPMGRVHHGQAGQAVALCLLAAFLAVVTVVLRTRAGRRTVTVALVLAFLATAAIGSNVSLVVSCAPVVAALGVLRALTVRNVRIRRAVGRFTLVTILVALLSVPLIPLYLTSLRIQSAGDVGYPVALPSPLTLVGLDPPRELDALSGPATAWAALLVVGLVLCGWVYLRRGHRPEAVATVIVLVIVALTGVLIFQLYGPESYNANKWLALVVPLLGPLVLGAALRLRWGWLPVLTRTVTVGCCVVAAVLAYRAGAQMRIELSEELYALRDSAVLDQVENLNINFRHVPGDPISESSVAALLVGSEHVTVMSSYDVTRVAPVGHLYLANLQGPPGGEVVSRVPLTDGYELQEVRLPLDWGTRSMGVEDPQAREHLYGYWHSPDGGGTWTGTERWAWVSFDVPPDAGDIQVTVTGHRYVDEDPRRVRIMSGGRVVARHTYQDNAAVDLSFVLTPEDREDGQVTLQIVSPDLEPSPTDPRQLGFMLSAITVQPLDPGAG